MIVGLLMRSLAAGEVNDLTISSSSNSLLDIPAQTWETEEDDEMLQAHAKSIQLTTLYTTSAIAFGASGYGFYGRANKMAIYDAQVRRSASLDHPIVKNAWKNTVPYTVLAYGGAALGLGLLSGAIIQVRPTSISVGFQF